MTRAVVIKTAGDPAMAGAIVDGMTQRVIPLNQDELAIVKAECARLRARDAVRAYGDSVRYKAACSELEARYFTPQHGRLYEAATGAWACFWGIVYSAYDYFSKWNREA